LMETFDRRNFRGRNFK